jgi:hypothetical protein
LSALAAAQASSTDTHIKDFARRFAQEPATSKIIIVEFLYSLRVAKLRCMG